MSKRYIKWIFVILLKWMLKRKTELEAGAVKFTKKLNKTLLHKDLWVNNIYKVNSPVNSFRPLDKIIVLTSDDFHSIFPQSPLLPISHPVSGSYPKLSRGAVFTVCSHTFTLFWMRKTFVIVETFYLSFCVFVCAFHPEISSFFR
jgi:hypothetical protein